MPKVIAIKDENEILTNIFALMKKKGIRQTDLANHLGISRTSISLWKSEHSRSYMNYIDEIASYLGLTSEELMNPMEAITNTVNLSTNEKKLIQLYRSLSDSAKTLLIQVANEMVN